MNARPRVPVERWLVYVTLVIVALFVVWPDLPSGGADPDGALLNLIAVVFTIGGVLLAMACVVLIVEGGLAVRRSRAHRREDDRA